MTNLNTASNAAPSVLVAQYVPSTGAAQYTTPVGTTADLVSVSLHNTDTVSRTVTFSVVRAGGSAGGGNRRLETVTMATKATIELGQMMLGDGDFIWAEAGTASTIALIVTGIEFSNASGAVLTGIQDDAIGTGGHGTATVTGTNKVGAANNRYLLGALMVQEGSATTGWASYTGLSMTCNDGSGALAMTRLVSMDFTNSGGAITGSVHLFGRATPTSGSTQTLTGAAAASGATMNLVLASKTYSGVASVTGAVSAASGAGASALSLAITSAVGHVPVSASLFFDVPQDFAITGGARQRYFNGVTSAFTIPKWLLFADALGAATVTASTSNSTQWAAVGADFVPA